MLEALAWASLLVGVWVTTLSGVTTSDMVTAAGCSLLCGALVTVVRRRSSWGPWRPPARTVAGAAWLPVAVLADTFRVLGLVVPHARARLHRRVHRHGPPELADVTVPAPPAAAILVVSAAPGSYVVDATGGGDPGAPVRLRVHAPVPGWPHLERRVGR